MSLLTGIVAIAIDTMLPAFDEIRMTFGLSADSNQTSLTITSFFVGLALGQLVQGPLADRFGRRPVLLVNLGLYTACAIVAALAPSLGFLIAIRALWGVAAAGPRIAVYAAVRDLFEGDDRARIMSFITAVFMITPVVAPALGEALLLLGSWRWVFGAGAVLAVVLAAWVFLRLPETLDPNDRRAFDSATILRGMREVLSHRVALVYTMASVFSIGSFLPWLGSSELLFSEVYGRGGQFAFWFGVNSVAMGIGTAFGAVLVRRYGAEAVARNGTLALVVAAGGYTAVAAAASGRPSFAAFMAGAALCTTLQTAVNPVLFSLAIEPMGHLAGTAVAVVGTISLALGAVLAAVVDNFIADSMLPLAVGFFVLSSISVVPLLWLWRHPLPGDLQPATT